MFLPLQDRDTSERQMTLEERIESMLNKSKANGMTGNKSKAEDTNFGDEADITIIELIRLYI